MIISNFNLTTFEYFVKLIDEFDFLQGNIKNQFAKIFLFARKHHTNDLKSFNIND